MWLFCRGLIEEWWNSQFGGFVMVLRTSRSMSMVLPEGAIRCPLPLSRGQLGVCWGGGRERLWEGGRYGSRQLGQMGVSAHGWVEWQDKGDYSSTAGCSWEPEILGWEGDSVIWSVVRRGKIVGAHLPGRN